MDPSASTLQNAWRLAMQREQDALDFYARLAEQETDSEVKALFAELAHQETEHKARLVREYRRRFEAEDLVDEPDAQSAARVAWMDWNDETFRLAQQLDLPILLDIHGVWCHWCHVMDRGTYTHPDVASIVNAEFIPVRVDTDRRPDINARYNMGGWPTTAILTPDGEVLTGRTYIPPDDMVRFLRQASEYYRENKGEVGHRLAQNEARRREAGAKARAAGSLSGTLLASVVEGVAEALNSGFDRVNGGFGDVTKFPHPDALELALVLYHRTADPMMRRIVELTMTNMATGGMYDREMGGFFRYSTTADWTVPHYEKMCDDNARLTRLYLQAYQVFGKELYRETAANTIGYMNDVLWDDAGSFFRGSQDADEQYYGLTRAERLQREAPYVDRTAYTNFNAMSAMALLEASTVLNQPGLARQATRILDFLWSALHEDGLGMFHFWDDGEAHVPGLLADQVWTAWALLHGFEHTGNTTYLNRAVSLMNESVYQHYVDESGAGYFDCVPDPSAAGRLKDGIKNIDENAWVAEVSMRLEHLTGDERYGEAAESALGAFAAGYRSYRYFASNYALAVDRMFRPYLRLNVAGPIEQPATRELLRAALSVYLPNRLVRVLDPGFDRDEIVRLGLDSSESPVLQVCRGDVCAEPVDDPAHVAAAVATLTAAG